MLQVGDGARVVSFSFKRIGSFPGHGGRGWNWDGLNGIKKAAHCKTMFSAKFTEFSLCKLDCVTTRKSCIIQGKLCARLETSSFRDLSCRDVLLKRSNLRGDSLSFCCMNLSVLIEFDRWKATKTKCMQMEAAWEWCQLGLRKSSDSWTLWCEKIKMTWCSFSLVTSMRSCCKSRCRTRRSESFWQHDTAEAHTTDFPRVLQKVSAEKKMERRKRIEDRCKLCQATLCSDVARVPHPCHRLHSILNKHSVPFLSLSCCRWYWHVCSCASSLAFSRCLGMLRPGDLGHGSQCGEGLRGGRKIRGTHRNSFVAVCCGGWWQDMRLSCVQYCTVWSQELRDDAKQLMDARAKAKLHGIQWHCRSFNKHPHPTLVFNVQRMNVYITQGQWKAGFGLSRAAVTLSQQQAHRVFLFNVSRYVKSGESQKRLNLRNNCEQQCGSIKVGITWDHGVV